MVEHKNKSRAPLKPLNVPTLGLSVFGLGFLRPAPGTWGSMPPPGVAWLLLIAGVTGQTVMLVTVALLLLSSIACVVWGGYAESRFGRKDAAEVVADETAGVCVPLLGGLAMGMGGVLESMIWCGIAFLLFRISDILKPWPARQLEQLPRGWGVLIDDLVAGVYACIVMIGAMWAWGAITA